MTAYIALCVVAFIIGTIVGRDETFTYGATRLPCDYCGKVQSVHDLYIAGRSDLPKELDTARWPATTYVACPLCHIDKRDQKPPTPVDEQITASIRDQYARAGRTARRLADEHGLPAEDADWLTRHEALIEDRPLTALLLPPGGRVGTIDPGHTIWLAPLAGVLAVLLVSLPHLLMTLSTSVSPR